VPLRRTATAAAVSSIFPGIGGGVGCFLNAQAEYNLGIDPVRDAGY
jgi:hypothetical protein